MVFSLSKDCCECFKLRALAYAKSRTLEGPLSYETMRAWYVVPGQLTSWFLALSGTFCHRKMPEHLNGCPAVRCTSLRAYGERLNSDVRKEILTRPSFAARSRICHICNQTTCVFILLMQYFPAVVCLAASAEQQARRRSPRYNSQHGPHNSIVLMQQLNTD
jgi:hypothetical protein